MITKIIDINFFKNFSDDFVVETDSGTFYCTESTNTLFANRFCEGRKFDNTKLVSDEVQTTLVNLLVNEKTNNLCWRFKYVRDVEQTYKVCVEYHGDMTRGDSTHCEGLFKDEQSAIFFMKSLRKLGFDAFVLGKYDRILTYYGTKI